MPLPTTRVFPHGWSAHHRPAATDTMTGQCVITRAATQIHSGACRVIADRSDMRASIGAQDLLTVRYLITVRYDVNDVEPGDIVEITDAADGGLVGRRFTVAEVRYGTQQWERDLYATDEHTSLPGYSQQLTIVRAPLVTGYGNSLTWDWPNASRTPALAAVTPLASTETTGARDEVTTTYTCQAPAGTDVRVTDRVEWDSRTFQVDGEPQAIPHPLTGAPHHVEFRLRIDEGG
ncbi:DUF6093 family protein [Spirillospora sp. CA-294931]|uniref:DUF6093 family protein n=1 Tax=Spirillospora sp. CA-294931 TaxID=3240042 RepID=UPI003D92790A